MSSSPIITTSWRFMPISGGFGPPAGGLISLATICLDANFSFFDVYLIFNHSGGVRVRHPDEQQH